MIDFEKFSKYSRPGPRYTSYPTAVEFSEGFGVNEYERKLENLPKDSELSLYVHLPFCKSACYFCGCNVVYTSKDDKKSEYTSYLKKELEILSKHLDTSLKVTQFHFGGGTPTFYSPSELDEIMIMVKSYFPNFATNAEIGIEVDPRYFDKEYMNVLKKHGFNRISFGIQDFETKVQEAVNRVQDFQSVKEAFALSREAGIESINVDLIYGLPFQSRDSFIDTIKKVVDLDPDRLAVFNYAHVPWMKKTMRKIDETTLPEPKEKLKILKDTISYLQKSGYEMIGMDHFAKPDDGLCRAQKEGRHHRNFQGYTTSGGVVMVGIGLTSIGEGKDYYVQNYKDLESYKKAIDSSRLPAFRGIELSSDDILRKAIIIEMMSNFRLVYKDIEDEFGIVFKEYFEKELEGLKEFEEAGLLSMSEEKIEINDTGSMLIRNIVMPFDAYLKKLPEEKRRFSKTI
ncbi:MAG: oxygen-independent coproporphyrinogen III oxidase [Campylobacterales bacterium]